MFVFFPFRETEKRKELVREVEMGPFKHEVIIMVSNLLCYFRWLEPVLEPKNENSHRNNSVGPFDSKNFSFYYLQKFVYFIPFFSPFNGLISCQPDMSQNNLEFIEMTKMLILRWNTYYCWNFCHLAKSYL